MARAHRRAEDLLLDEAIELASDVEAEPSAEGAESSESVVDIEGEAEAVEAEAAEPSAEADADTEAAEPDADTDAESGAHFAEGAEPDTDAATGAHFAAEPELDADTDTESADPSITEFVFPGRVVRAKRTEPVDERISTTRPERVQGERGWFGIFDRNALPIAIIYLELVLKSATTGDFFPSIIFIALFSIAWGEFFRLISMLGPKRKDGRRIRTVILAILGVVYSINYFLFRQFKVFYDLKTSLLGAADAATGFSSTIWDLVSSQTGIIHIVLFMLPAVVYGVVCAVRGKDSREEAQSPRVGWIAAGVYASHLLVLLLIMMSPAQSAAYWNRYSFQTSVPNFGLLTGLRKDAQSILFPSSEGLFQQVDTRSATSQGSGENSDSGSGAKAKGANEMDIDFEALAKNASAQHAQMDAYVSSLVASSKNEMTGKYEGYNLIFVSAEALSAEAIREDTTPTLWRMANKGIQFTDYYQFDTAGTTGGECANIFGMLATEGGDSVKGTSSHNNYFTIGNALNREGYNGWAFHNNTYTFYSRDTTHTNLGYNNGFVGYGNGMEEWVTWQWPQSDLEMVQGTFDNLYGDAEPFNVYYMSVSGHSGYSRNDNMMTVKYWDEVKDLEYSDLVKGYLACNIDLDRAMEYLIAQLEEKGIADRTLIVMGADHFPYGLDEDAPLGQLPNLSELYGYDVKTYFQRDHNRLIMWSASMEKEDPIVVDTPTSAIDILPTLLNMFGVEWDSRLLPGRDVFSDAEPLIFDLSYDWKTDLGTYYAGSNTFEPKEGAEIPADYVDIHNTIVQNKISYMRGVLQTDYYRHVFGDPEDVQAVHDRGVAERESHTVPGAIEDAKRTLAERAGEKDKQDGEAADKSA